MFLRVHLILNVRNTYSLAYAVLSVLSTRFSQFAKAAKLCSFFTGYPLMGLAGTTLQLVQQMFRSWF